MQRAILRYCYLQKAARFPRRTGNRASLRPLKRSAVLGHSVVVGSLVVGFDVGSVVGVDGSLVGAQPAAAPTNIAAATTPRIFLVFIFLLSFT